MRFIVMTSPAFGNNFLKELLVSGLRPEFVVTKSPYHVSAKNRLTHPVLKILKYLKFFKNRGTMELKYQPYFLAKKHKIPVFSSETVNTQAMEKRIKDLEIDYAFTFVFKILKPNIFSAPNKGCINFHPSDLPTNRGATPWNWIVRQHRDKTRISFHRISKGIDAGEIIKQIDVPIPKDINSNILREFLFNMGSTHFVKLIHELKIGVDFPGIENRLEDGSYDPPFSSADARLEENLSFEDVVAVINSSRDSFNNATIRVNGNKYSIINCVELNEPDNLEILNERIEEDGNLLYRTSDNRLVLLITNKTQGKLK